MATSTRVISSVPSIAELDVILSRGPPSTMAQKRKSRTFEAIEFVSVVSVALAIVSIDACIVGGTRRLSGWINSATLSSGAATPDGPRVIHDDERVDTGAVQIPQCANQNPEALQTTSAHSSSTPILRPLCLPELVTLKERIRSQRSSRRTGLRPLSLPGIVARRSLSEPNFALRRPASSAAAPSVHVQKLHAHGRLSASLTEPLIYGCC
ncbi:hypothetical protein HGRIS_010899 [Hohenbuehelia grisea]|uniref:Uncharacterized protein n=1 Tax=Hohenbuehelia grisea TaxID=104357 RepID=A0ABR3IYG6_9AGAR